MRDELLKETLFLSMADARVEIATWGSRHYRSYIGAIIRT
jgi:hypothetical protein